MSDLENTEVVNEELNNEVPEVESNEQEVEKEKDPTPKEEAEQKEPGERDISELPLPGEEEESKTKSDMPKWVEKRLSKKEKELAEIKAAAEAYRMEAEKLKQTTQQHIPKSNHDMPHRDDFDNESDYIEAVMDYRDNKRIQQEQESRRAAAIQQAESEFQTKLQTAQEEGEKKYEDFEDKVEALFRADFPPNRAMGEAIVDSSFKADILYFLGNYPLEAKKIALMNPIQAVKKIAEIEQRFAAKKRSSVTKAPPAISPVSTGGGSAVISNKAPENMQDFKEWYKAKYGR